MLESSPDFASWILGSMSSGVVAIDADGAVVALNAGAQRILGCPVGEASACLGRDCREVLDTQPTVARLLLDALRGRGGFSRAELVLEGASRRIATTIGFTLSPVRDDRDRMRGAAMIFRDLTPFERADEQDRLRERLAALGQMAAGLAHEIRNPLAGMEVLTGLLKRRLGDRPEEQALLEELTGELRDLADTVSASLDFVRPVSPVRAPVNAAELLEDSLSVARSRVPFAGTVERAFDGDLPELNADADQLRAVFTNLIVNAFEAMAGSPSGRRQRLTLALEASVPEVPGRAVRVGSDGRRAPAEAAPRRELVITVGDTGTGIEPEIRERIFYPFFTTKERGSGVGLAMVQKIVASHGGVVEVDTCPGAGCTFRVHLPVGERSS